MPHSVSCIVGFDCFLFNMHSVCILPAVSRTSPKWTNKGIVVQEPACLNVFIYSCFWGNTFNFQKLFYNQNHQSTIVWLACCCCLRFIYWLNMTAFLQAWLHYLWLTIDDWFEYFCLASCLYLHFNSYFNFINLTTILLFLWHDGLDFMVAMWCSLDGKHYPNLQ